LSLVAAQQWQESPPAESIPRVEGASQQLADQDRNCHASIDVISKVSKQSK